MGRMAREPLGRAGEREDMLRLVYSEESGVGAKLIERRGGWIDVVMWGDAVGLTCV